MKLIDFKKSKEELQNQITQNNQSFLKYDEQYRMAKTNQTDYKIGTTAFFSLLAYLGIFVGNAISIAITDAPLFASIPRLIYPAIVLGTSVGLGSIARHFMDKKFKLKERLSAFTKAKNDTEKLVEEIKNEIELKKIETRSYALSKTIEKLNEDEEQLKIVSERYTINDKEEKTQDSSKKKAAILMSTLQEKFSQLDSLVTKKVLSDRFFHQRQKGQGTMDIIMTCGGIGVATMLYYTLSLMLVSIHATGPLIDAPLAPLILFTPCIISGLGAGIYYQVKNKSKQKAFSILNETLKENALPSNTKDTYEETQQLQNLIDNTITELVTSTIELQEEKRYLERFNISETVPLKPSEELEKSKELTTRERRQDSLIDSEEEIYPEEIPYETLTSQSGLRQEIKTLAKRRKRPY